MNSSKKYSRTLKGLINKTYWHQRATSKKKGYPAPEYTKCEFHSWYSTRTNLPKLWNDWVASGYKKELKPSADRVNPHIHYKLDNLRLVTFGENNKKGRNEKPYLRGKTHRPVTCYDESGNFLCAFLNCKAMAKYLEIDVKNIYNVLSGKQGSSKGYSFKQFSLKEMKNGTLRG